MSTADVADIVDNIMDHGEDSGSLKSIFYSAFTVYNNRFREDHDDELDNSALTQRESAMTLAELRQIVNRIAFFIERLSLFSINEDLEDISTGDLIFLLVPFILAELSSHSSIRDNRKQHLETSLIYWREFLRSMERLNLCSQLDLKRINRNEQPISVALRREEKIASYNEHRELDNQVKVFVSKRQKLGVDPHKWNIEGVDDELERSLALALLKRSINESIEHIHLVEQELEFLSVDRSTLTRTSPNETLKKPFLLTIRDPSELRNMYLDKVFKPFHELPTISLAEVAKWEMEVEVGQLGAEERRKMFEKKNRKNIENVDTETQETDMTNSDDEPDEEKEKKERNWDDWKDENPKGIGNKNRNVG